MTRARERYFEALRVGDLPWREMTEAGPDVVGKWLAVEKKYDSDDPRLYNRVCPVFEFA